MESLYLFVSLLLWVLSNLMLSHAHQLSNRVVADLLDADFSVKSARRFRNSRFLQKCAFVILILNGCLSICFVIYEL